MNNQTNKKNSVGKKVAQDGKEQVKKLIFKVNLNKLFSQGLVYLIILLLFVPMLLQFFSGDFTSSAN